MTAERADVAPRWLVITPNLAIEHWLEAIQTGAAAAGLHVMVDGFGAAATDALECPDFVVTDDVARALASGAESIVIILPTPWSAPDALEARGEDYSAAIISASRLLVQVDGLDARHRVIGSDQLTVEGAPLEIFPDLIISIPPSVGALSNTPLKSAAAQVLRNLYAGGRIADGISSTWPLELFSHHASSLIEGRLGEFDLTGRPKFLVSGPYLWMPAGAWTARIRFAVDEEASGRRFRFDWGGMAEWTEQYFTPDHSGLYEMELTHTFPNPEACEVRFLITEGCFTGRADFHGVTITRAVPTSEA